MHKGVVNVPFSQRVSAATPYGANSSSPEGNPKMTSAQEDNTTTD